MSMELTIQQSLLRQLRQLHLSAMAEALQLQQSQSARYLELAFEERLQLLLEQELTARLDRRHQRLILSLIHI